MHALSDLLIAVSYFFIPFSAFCWYAAVTTWRSAGLTFFSAWFIFISWHHAPFWRRDALVSGVPPGGRSQTADGTLVSGATAVLLIRLVPAAVALPGPERFTHQLRTANARTAELAAALDRTQSLESARFEREHQLLEQRLAIPVWLVTG